MLELGNSLNVAREVLNRVMKFDDVNGWVEVFENCREQGYRVIADLEADEGYKVRTIAFAENRNSDNIVVYHVEGMQSATFGYSDEFWNNKRYFDPEAYDEAAEYIHSLIITQ